MQSNFTLDCLDVEFKYHVSCEMNRDDLIYLRSITPRQRLVYYSAPLFCSRQALADNLGTTRMRTVVK